MPSNRLELNGRLAMTLSSPILAVLDARPCATAASLFNTASIAINNLRDAGAAVLGVALNRVRGLLRRWLQVAPSVAGQRTEASHIRLLMLSDEGLRRAHDGGWP